jgi:DNA-binding transcriptional regulator PaaX
MALGLAVRTIITLLLKSRDFCAPEREIRAVLKSLGYSDRSAYVYIHRLSKRGVVNRHRIGTATQVCLKVARLRDLGAEIAVLW